MPNPLTLLTWNINSVRLRFDQLARLVAEAAPDVICLQETKCPNPLFPALESAALGYPHQAIHGMKGYNGVAILSRLPLDDVRQLDWCGKQDCRHIAARVAGFDLHNLYVPAGGDIPDPEINPKFRHKLDFLTTLSAWFGESFDPADPMMLVGDLNIAPLPSDVWDHKKLLRTISHTPVEVAHLDRLQNSLAWDDIARRFIPAPEPLFTWWSYRQGKDGSNWRGPNRGRRLDHIWTTPGLTPRIQGFSTLPNCRDWQPPSDHVPVLVTVE